MLSLLLSLFNVFNPDEYHITICIQSCLFTNMPGQPAIVQLAILGGKNFNFRRYMQNFIPNSFTPTILAGTIDFCHCIPLLLTLTLTGGLEVSTR